MKRKIIALALSIMMVMSICVPNTFAMESSGQPKLICTKVEHTHSESCYGPASSPGCGLEETAGHTHGGSCYTTEQITVCTSTDAAHTHGDTCYTSKQTLVCTQEESAGHVHAQSCYERVLHCAAEEHLHSAACYAAPAAEPTAASATKSNVEPTAASATKTTGEPTAASVTKTTEEPTAAPASTTSTGTSFETLPADVQETILSLIYEKEGLNSQKMTRRSSGAMLRAAAVEQIEAKWFRIEPANVTEVPSGGIAVGDISGNKTIPTVEDYTFVGAYFNDVQVLRVGQIVYDANKDGTAETFVYYVTNPDNTDLIAQVLSEGDQIELRYRENPVAITYAVTMDQETVAAGADGSYTVQGIPYGSAESGNVVVLPASSPTEVFKGDSFSFHVEIPRGYTATVSVDGQEVLPELGISPAYELEKDEDGDRVGHGTIIKSDPDSEYLLEQTYTVENVQKAPQITVALTSADAPTFSAELVSYTDYFGGALNQHGDRAKSFINREGEAPYGNVAEPKQSWTGTFEDGSLTWNLETQQGASNAWLMDSLQLNGSDIKLPFDVDIVETTVLPSGTVVEVTLDAIDWSRHRYYSIAISQCYEDIVVTGGNLNSTTWMEYIPYEFTGVAQFQYLNAAGTWVDADISQPIARGEIDPKRTFRFRLERGYGLPHFALDESDNEHTPIINPQDMTDRDQDGWYTVDFSDGNTDVPNFQITDDDFPILILVRAEQIKHKVVYTSGNVENAAPIPVDDQVYSVAEGEDDDVLTPLPAPIDPSGAMIFIGWRNGDTVYRRNQNLPITELDAVWDADQQANVITFTAEWIEAEKAKTINYTLEVHRSDLPESEDTLRETYYSEAPKDVDVVIDVNAGSLKKWLDANPWFEVDMDKTILYYESLENNQTIYLYVREKTAPIHYWAVGPEGATDFGAVAPVNEELKIHSGEAAGSTATAGKGFRFVGWFEDANGTQPVPDEWVNGDKIVPRKEGDMWEEASYYAVFERALADLTIKKSGASDVDENQSFVFSIQGTGDDGTAIDTNAVVHGNGSVTIKDLPIGTYTVTEESGWSWRYTADEGSKEVVLKTGENTVEFVNKRQKTTWLNGSAWCDNQWILGSAIHDND